MKYQSVPSIYLSIYLTLQLVRQSRASGNLIEELRSTFFGSKSSLNLDKNYAVLDTVNLVKRHGYPAEDHELTTADGYILRIFRISGNSSSLNSSVKPVVFLQHGVLWSSDAFVLLGPDHALSFMLADAGYDVWIGNVRGNTYGKKHKILKTTSSEFWNFSYHEMGTRDLPAMIDHVLDRTSQRSLSFIGHSMGATIAYVMLSRRPEYNKKIKLLVSLAPVTFWRHELNPLQSFFQRTAHALQDTLERHNVHEILPRTNAFSKKLETWCHEDAVSHAACINIIFRIVGDDHEQFNSSLLPYLFSSFPAGTSLRTMVHFHQNLRSGEFQEYDYKLDENFVRYSRVRSRNYQLQKITAPVALIYGRNDAIVTAQEIYELASHLKNITTLEAVPFRKFNHMDFIWARGARSLLYKRILELVEQRR